MSQPLVQYALSHLSVTTNLCTRQKHEHGYTLDRRTVPDYNFIYLLRGGAVWVVEGKPWPLKMGGLILVPPRVWHHAFSANQRMTLVSIHVEAALPGGQDVFQLLNPPRCQTIPSQSRLDQYFRGAAAEFDRSPETETVLMMPGWAHLIVREFIRFSAESGCLRPRMADPLVATLLEELERRFDQPVTLADLAARAGFSAQHLNRVFRRALGMTPLQYLLRTRMERAALLLREGRLTVNAIARQVGFEDAGYFSRLFRNHHGQSPVQYRKRMDSDSPS